MTHLIMTFYIFFSFPSGLRQHCCFKNARLFLGLPAKNQINPKVLMLLLSLCRLVNVVGVGCTPALSEAGRLKLLSCRAAAGATASVASATASKTWGWRRSSSSRRGAPNFDPQIIKTFDPHIIETHKMLSEAGCLKLLSCCRHGLSGLRNGLQKVRMTTKLDFS